MANCMMRGSPAIELIWLDRAHLTFASTDCQANVNATVSYAHSSPAACGADSASESAGRLEKTERYPRLNGAGFANLAASTAPFACTSLSSTSIRMYVWVTVL